MECTLNLRQTQSKTLTASYHLLKQPDIIELGFLRFKFARLKPQSDVFQHDRFLEDPHSSGLLDHMLACPELHERLKS